MWTPFKRKDPFADMEEHNNKTGIMFDLIEKYTDPMEKLIKGMEHLLGEDWFKSEEVEQTPMQRKLTSTLLVIVLHNSLSETKKEVSDK